MITEDGSYVNFSGASFTSDNCSDIGTVLDKGDTYTIDLGSANNVQGYGFYTTYGESSRSTVTRLYYSDDNFSWTQLEHQQISTYGGCGEYNRNVDLSIIAQFTYYDNKQIKSKTHYKDDLRNGLSTTWFENGQIKSKIHYKDDIRDGEATKWFESGQIKSKIHYKDDIKNGLSTTWFESGQIKSKIHYKDDIKNGLSTTWFENGQINTFFIYKDGDLVGQTQYQYYDNNHNNGIDSVKIFKHNRLNGKSTFYWENGQKFIDGSYKDDKPDGNWTYWDENGRKKEEFNYKDGDLVDKTIFKYTYFTGKLKSKKKYKDGKCISGC
jgi:antitoxin component YwqK of YwqJK toxin-antitoxin module